MKRLLLVTLMVLGVCVIKAQDKVDTADVGPYKVVLDGTAYPEYWLAIPVADLYDYYNLKKDTVIQVQVQEQRPEPLKFGFLLDVFYETGTYRSARYSMAYGIDGICKSRVANKTYLSYGLSFGYAATTYENLKEDIIEIGLPLLLEWSNINSKKASLYGGIGITTTYYLTLKAQYATAQYGEYPGTYNGVYIAPRLDFGVYIPVGRPIIKVGIDWRYKINCSTKEYDVYKEVVGRSFLGANVGIMF